MNNSKFFMHIKLLPCLKCGKPMKTWAGRRICPKCTDYNNNLSIVRLEGTKSRHITRTHGS